jgi:sporulation protein YunB
MAVGRFRPGRRKMRWTGKSKKRFYMIGFFIAMLLTVQSFIYIETRLTPALMEIAKVRTKQIATQAINDAISKKIAQNADFNELVNVTNDKYGRPSVMMFNTMEYARIIGEATHRVQNTLHDLEQESQPIPLGMALNSTILTQFGPDIPIEIVPMGAVTVDLKPEYAEAGINTIIVTVYIQIAAEVRVVVPFSTDSTVVSTKIPITHATLMGTVPNFYYKGNGEGVGTPQDSGEPKVNFGPSFGPPGNTGDGGN